VNVEIKCESVSSLENEVILKELSDEIEVNGSILITWFREKGIAIPGNTEEQIEAVMEKVQQRFESYSIKELDWPSGLRTSMDTKRPSHPLISHICRIAIIVHRPNFEIIKGGVSQNKGELSNYQIALTLSVYNYLAKNAESRWTLLGDETGGLLEFKGRSEPLGRTSAMCWVAIPPKSQPPNLPPNFHATGSMVFLKNSLQVLEEDHSIILFVFPYEQGIVADGLSRIAKNSNLSFWRGTLPLVLEYISNINQDKKEIDVFVEQAKVAEAGSDLLQPIIQELKTSLDKRLSWQTLTFKELWVLAKSPCEHPWMGYPDGLGHTHIDNLNRDDETNHLVESLRKRVIRAPYRQASFDGPIGQVMRNTADSLTFLKSLSDLSLEDIKDYIIPFFSNAIVEASNSLDKKKWQKLLSHFKNTAENIEGQHAAQLILSGIDIDFILKKLPDKRDKFEFLKAVLGSSNHVGATKVANKCKLYIEELRDEDEDEKLVIRDPDNLELKTLSGGANDNQFDFSHISDDFEFLEEEPIKWSDEEINYFGAQALSRALRCDEGDIDLAWEIENKLLAVTHGDEKLRRRYILRSELLMERKEYDLARRALEFEFPERIGHSDNNEHLTDRYFLATLLKSCALSSATESFQDYSRLVLKSLDEKHPSQRIAYWYCRWAHEIAQTDNDVFAECLQHLKSLKTYDFFKKEAPGVILACELIDLNKRGIEEECHEQFLSEVLKNSEIYAQEWVALNSPNENDWLAPLNFNYR